MLGDIAEKSNIFDRFPDSRVQDAYKTGPNPNHPHILNQSNFNDMSYRLSISQMTQHQPNHSRRQENDETRFLDSDLLERTFLPAEPEKKTSKFA